MTKDKGPILCKLYAPKDGAIGVTEVHSARRPRWPPQHDHSVFVRLVSHLRRQPDLPKQLSRRLLDNPQSLLQQHQELLPDEHQSIGAG